MGGFLSLAREVMAPGTPPASVPRIAGLITLTGCVVQSTCRLPASRPGWWSTPRNTGAVTGSRRSARAARRRGDRAESRSRSTALPRRRSTTTRRFSSKVRRSSSRFSRVTVTCKAPMRRQTLLKGAAGVLLWAAAEGAGRRQATSRARWSATSTRPPARTTRSRSSPMTGRSPGRKAKGHVASPVRRARRC